MAPPPAERPPAATSTASAEHRPPASPRAAGRGRGPHGDGDPTGTLTHPSNAPPVSLLSLSLVSPSPLSPSPGGTRGAPGRPGGPWGEHWEAQLRPHAVSIPGVLGELSPWPWGLSGGGFRALMALGASISPAPFRVSLFSLIFFLSFLLDFCFAKQPLLRRVLKPS